MPVHSPSPNNAGNLRVAVITPCYNPRPAWLDQCRASVQAQTLPCTHIVVNDGGLLPALDADGRTQVIHLPRPHIDAGNAARAVGSVSAIRQEFDAVAYLDADNWYEPNHLESLAELHRETGAAVCSSSRDLYRPDGTRLGRCPEVDGDGFVDTNCLFLTRKAYAAVATWYLMPAGRKLVGDRVVWESILDMGLLRAHSDLPTVGYRTSYHGHYVHFGVAAPAEAKWLAWDPMLRQTVARTAF